MTIKQAYVRKPTIQIDFITESNVFSLKYKTDESLSDQGNVINKGDLSSAILSFSVDNDMNSDSGTFILNLVGSERFDRILSPNDITIIRVNPGKPNNVKNDCIMVGMITSIKRVGEYDSSSVVYQVNGQSMFKAMMQLKLGTIQEAASLLGTNGWMWGMGGLKQASSYTASEDSDSSSDSANGNTNAEKIWNQLRSSGFSKYAAAGILGNMYAESGVDPNATEAGGGGGYGLVQWTPKSKLTAYANSVGKSESSLSLQVEFLVKQLKGTTSIFPDTAAYQPLMNATSVSEATKVFLDYYERAGVANLQKRVTAAQGYYDSYKGNSTKKTASSEQSTTTSGSQGITLQGESAAGVAAQLIKWFLVLHTKYSYKNSTKTLVDYIDSDLTSWSEDERLTDPTTIMSYEGSLRELISDVQAKPFNEFFGDYTTDGKMKMIMRKTPFEPDEWKRLLDDSVKLYSNDVVEESLGVTDEESYSIFLANMPSNVAISDISTYLSSPVYFPNLANKYGYSLLQVDNPYIFAYGQSATSGGSSDTGKATGGGSPITKATVDNIKNATMSWTTKKDVTASNLDNFIAKSNPVSKLKGTGKYFIEAGNKTGLNPVILLAFAANESAWGNSTYGASYNFFGIGAYDSNPDNAYKYSNNSAKSGIINGAKFIKNDYFDAGQKTLRSLFVNNGIHQYSTSGDKEADTIASIVANYYNMYPNALQKAQFSMEGGKITVKKTEKTSSVKGVSTDDSGNQTRLKKYSVLLANWFGDNASYVSGEIRVIGNPDYRVGKVLSRFDNGQASKGSNEPIQIDYYIESTSHEFNLSSGYTTTLGVTRGLVHSVDRFKHWNSWNSPLTSSKPGNGELQIFDGGLFGEISLKKNIKESAKEAGSGSNSGGSDDLSAPKKAGDDYPSKYKNASPDSVADEWRYLNRECTSFVAWRLSRDGKTNFSGLGNAISWASRSGLPLQKTPKVGDIAWFNELAAPGAAGHVAYVAKVSGDDVFIEEYNFNPEAIHAYHTRTIKKTQASGYLRFKNK